MKNVATLPMEHDRRFHVHMYWISHGLLLLRSGKDKRGPTRVDILFSDVRWMNIPMWMNGIRIERCQLSDIPLPSMATILKEAHLMSVYKIISEGVDYFMLAGENISLAEDALPLFANSPLLKHFDFRAFTAPLWKKD